MDVVKKVRKKVLFVATVATHIKGFHSPYLSLFKENGYKTYVASAFNLNVGEKIDYCDKFIELPIQRNPIKLQNLNAIKLLRTIINEEKFDIIHCHTPMGAVVARLAAYKARKKYGTRVIYTAHGFHFYKGAPLLNWLLFYPIEKWLAKYTDTLITINKEDYNRAKDKFSKRCKDIQYVPGVGIDTKKFDFEMSKQEKLELRKSLGLKKYDFVLIFPARLDKNKNQIFLINCMEQLVKDHNNIHLLLPGRDELNGYYQSIVKEKGLENKIHFLGFRKDIAELMKISDVAVSSSLREGLPVNVMEAFSCKKTVVALNCRGMNDLIIQGENGFIVDNIEEFVNKIKCIYDNKKHYGFEFDSVLKKINIDFVCTKMKEIYFVEK